MVTETLEGFELSPQQKHLWSLQQGDGRAVYRSCGAITLNGDLDPELLAKALQCVVERHETLRTRFQLLPGMSRPLQVISPEAQFGYVCQDLQTLPEAEREAQRRVLRENAVEPAAEKERQILCITHLIFGPGRHEVALELPAMYADATSLYLLARQIRAAYLHFKRGAPLPDPQVQYADIADMLNECLTAEEFDIGRQFWRSRDLGGRIQSRAALESPPANFRPRMVRIPVADRLAAMIDEFCARSGVSREGLLLAAWGVLKCRLEMAEEVLISLGCDGRTHDLLVEAIGALSRYVPFLFRLRSGGSFEELARVVDSLRAEVWEEQHYFDPEAFGAGGTAAGVRDGACFEYVRLSGGGETGEHAMTIELLASVSNCFLSKLTAIQDGARLRLQVEYDASVSSETEALRLGEAFTNLLESALKNPGWRSERLEILSSEARRKILAFSRGPEAQIETPFVHEAFEQQARRRPDAVAVVSEERSLSYDELNRRTNQLGQYLRRLGVGPDTRVGLYLERSLEMVIGLLGILKAGGAYLPLDRNYPAERLAFMLDDAKVIVMLTQESLAATLDSGQAQIVCLDEKWGQIAQEEVSCPDAGVTAQNLAYVIYTSGSTGQPKGVLVTHRGLPNMAEAKRRAFELGPHSRVLQFAALSFDGSAFEILGALAAGAALYLPAPGHITWGPDLIRLVRDQEITTMTIPPSVLATLPEEELPGLRTLVVAGEACPAGLARVWRRGRCMINGYGPTEATVAATMNKSGEWDGNPSIGKPIANAQVYILDGEMNPVPIKVKGELCIGGVGLARCYNNRADLTAERFLPDRFSLEPGARIYRTGDLGRWLPMGEVEFVGRNDHQVKIRGFRIELEEIEAALEQHDCVKQSVVIATEDEAGDQRLVAYIVVAREQAVSGAELRKYLGEKLPEYMAPAVYVELKELPMLPNGKLDRKALPAPTTSSEAGRSKGPRTPVEEILAGILAEVLGLEEVGAEENFFALGGHSLLATQVASRVRGILQVELPVREFFESPTVASMAEAVERKRRARRGVEAPPIKPVGRESELPLSFAQQRLWFIQQLEPESVAYNIPIVMMVKGEIQTRCMWQSLGEIERRHEALRTRFEERDGRPVQVIDEAREVEAWTCDLSGVKQGEREECARKIAERAGNRPFALDGERLWRAGIIRLEDEEQALVVGMHHVVSDGWSTGVMIREFSRIYESYVSGRQSPLEELEVQYADYAVWQREWLQGEALAGQLEYWRAQLAGAPALELPTDRPRPAIAGHRGANVHTQCSLELSQGLKELSRREGVTLFMALLASFQALLGRYSGQPEAVIGTDVANRNRLETEGLIGFFVNQLVLRTDLSGNPSFRELLGRVRETTLNAYMYQDLPFEKLVEELAPERSLGRAPLFQVMMTLQHEPSVADSTLMGGQQLPFNYKFEEVRLDLELTMVETSYGLVVNANYNTELFDRSTVARMLRHLEQLLAVGMSEPCRGINELSLLTRAEEWQLLNEWNDTEVREGDDECFYQVFERQVESRPDAIAVSQQGRWVSYRELNRRAGRVASALTRHGVGPEVNVGVQMNRSLELLIAIIALFKTGGVYVPLDPGYPADRLRMLRRLGETRIILTSGEEWDNQNVEAEEVVRDREPVILKIGELSRRAEEEEMEVKSRWESGLAYLIFTSGSTGTPKGVMIEQGGMLNHIYAKIESLELNERDTIGVTASPSFDISVWQFLTGLVVGGRAHVVGVEEAVDPKKLIEEVCEERVTVLEVVPSLLGLMMAEGEWDRGLGKERGALKSLMVTGEALPVELCRRWMRKCPDIPMVNAYGPTECSDDVTQEMVCGEPGEESIRVPIGRPLRNSRAYIVDVEDSLAPIGVEGEIVLGGKGVGRGYYRDAERTALSFAPDGKSGERGQRLYRTGDVGRYRWDGRVEYVGRKDQQVKVRGNRIELGEIEAALNEHGAVEQAVVMVREDSPGEKQLVAYVVKPRGQEPGYEEELDSNHWKVADWQNVFEQVYADRELPTQESLINHRVWISSYTDRPFPEEEILACVEDTVARILALEPKRVLEIGCGTGLILSRVAPKCEVYYGTDFSGEALNQLRQSLGRLGLESKVRLFEQEGDNFKGIPRRYFDLVVINEVVQYFPSIQYLLRILEQIPELVLPESVIFLGDLRNLELLETFRASVEVAHTAESIDLNELRQRINKSMRREKELLIDPGFFSELKKECPWIEEIEIELKGGDWENELVKYRYDAIVYLGWAWRERTGRRYLNWQRDGLSLNSLRQALDEGDRSLEIEGIPNKRVGTETRILEMLTDEFRTHNLGELRQILKAENESSNVSPQQLWELGREKGYRVQLSWPSSGPLGAYRAIFQRQPERRKSEWEWDSQVEVVLSPEWRKWNRYANQPLQEVVGREQAVSGTELRNYLGEKLPEYMIPSNLVFLDALPLLPSGKIDRRALPAPGRPRADRDRVFVGPRTPVEVELAKLWRQLLNLEEVSIYDNFFELGGHSLLLIQLGSRIRNLFHVDLPLRVLFDTTTLVDMREAILAQQVSHADAATVEELMDRLKHLSPDEINLLLEEGRADLYEYSE